MRLPICWTQDSIDHIAEHGLSRQQVDTALAGRLYKRKSGDLLIITGRALPVCLFIVLRPCPHFPGHAEVATARVASDSEKRLFDRRGKKRR